MDNAASLAHASDEFKSRPAIQDNKPVWRGICSTSLKEALVGSNIEG
jgi:hypothetical protein